MIVTPDASVLLNWVLPGDDEQDTDAALSRDTSRIRVVTGKVSVPCRVPVPVFWTSGRLKHQAALLLSFSRARAGVMYPCRWRSQPLL